MSYDEGLGQPAAICCASGQLLVIPCYGQKSLGTRHLHLEVSIVGDRHELGQSRLAKQCLVWALKVHHLKPDLLSAEVIFVSKEDIYLDLADW